MFTARRLAARRQLDFPDIRGAVEKLDGGVVLSVGSAIMAPQVLRRA